MIEEKQKKYYLGSFLSLMENDLKARIPNRDEKLIIRPQFMSMKMEPIRKLKQKTLRLNVLSKSQEGCQKKNYFIDEYIDDGTTKVRQLQQHGHLLHCYNEIWCFLLAKDYVKLKAKIYGEYHYTDKSFENNKYLLLHLDVYLKEQAIQDNYELKILRYKQNQEPSISDGYAYRDECQQEALRFGRLSLLLLFDLLCVYKPIPSLIKSDKQFKIFFSNIAHIHGIDVFKSKVSRFAFKDTHKLIMESQKDFEKYMSQSSHNNKLFDRKDLEQLIIIKNNNQFVTTQGKKFVVDFREITISDSLYFQRFAKDFMDKFRSFIKRSSETILKAHREEYRMNCYFYLFVKPNLVLTEFKSLFDSKYRLNTLYSYQLQDFIRVFKDMSCYCHQHIVCVGNKKQQQYIPSTLPLIEKLVGMKNYENTQAEMYNEMQKLREGTPSIQVNVIHEIMEGSINERKKEIEAAVQAHFQQGSAEQEINGFLTTNEASNINLHDTPKKMKSELKKHQKQALSWMLYREQKIEYYYEGQQKVQERQLSPLWEQIILQDGTQLYVNSFTGKISPDMQQFQQTKGGILADEMGLGKTIMALALILETHQQGQQTLIIVPKSVLMQWEVEIKQHSLFNSLSILLYYKKMDRKKHIKFRSFDVILTTYAVLGMDYADYLEKQNEEQKKKKNKQNGEEEEDDMKIFDELQESMKKSMMQIKKQKKSKQAYKQVQKKEKKQSDHNLQFLDSSDDESSLDGSSRLPILKPQSSDDENENESDYTPNTKQQYQRPQKQKQSQQLSQIDESEVVSSPSSINSDELEEQDPSDDEPEVQVNRFTKAYKMYQSRQTKINQMQIQQQRSMQSKTKKKSKKQPKKKRTRDKSLLNLFDFSYYRIILDEAHNIKNRTSLQSKGAFALEAEYRWCLTGTPMQNKHDDLFSLVQFLRVETFGEYFWWNTYINKEENEDDQQQILNQILSPILLRRVKNPETVAELKEVKEKIVWVDLTEQERMLYNRIFKGTQNLFSNFLKKDDNNMYVHIFQIINKLRMTCDHPQMALKDIDLTNKSMDQILKRIDAFLKYDKQMNENYKKDLIERIQSGEFQECAICTNDEIEVFDVSKCGHVFCHACFNEAVLKQGRCPSCRAPLIMKDLYQVRTQNEKATEQFQEIKLKTSSKLDAVIAATKEVKAKQEKCLIFSQWMDMIKQIEKQFKEQDIYYLTIDGSMTTDKRSKIINKFKEMNHVTALVLSLRATSTGLNLTMANHVFLVDPWWNPAIEDQAIGRADRIGQKLQVHVTRFLCKNTIEQKINLLHQKKKHLIKKAISNEQKKQAEIEDFKFLLQE